MRRLPQSAAELRDEAARIRRQAYATQLSGLEREGFLRDAARLEHRADALEPPELPPPPAPSGSKPPDQGPPPPPPLPPDRPFNTTPRQVARFQENARRAGVAVEVAERGGYQARAQKYRREVRGWEKLAAGLMPLGWTLDGPVGGSRGSKGPTSGKHPQGGGWTIRPPVPRDPDVLAELGSRPLEFACHCGKIRQIAAFDLAQCLAPGARLADAMKRLKCTDCDARLSSVKVLPP